MIDRFGADAFRYFLLREIPFGQDGDFSHESFIGRINADLANGLGNLLSRTVTLVQRFCQGIVPAPDPSAITELETDLQSAAEVLMQTTMPHHLQRIEFNRTLEAIWGLVQLGDQYIDKTAPWVLAKNPDDAQQLRTVLFHAAETLRFLCLAVYPFMPDTGQEMARQLGLGLDFSQAPLKSPIVWGGGDPAPPWSRERPYSRESLQLQRHPLPSPNPKQPSSAERGRQPDQHPGFSKSRVESRQSPLGRTRPQVKQTPETPG